MYRSWAFGLTLALIAFGSSLPALAASTGLSIQPIKISEEIKKGQSVSGFILLTNASDEDIQVDVTVQDFIPEAGSDAIQFVSRAPGVTTVRDWITIGGNQAFVFKKGEARRIPYTISAPSNAEPGSHFGVAFFKATRLADAAAGLKIGTQVGMLIFVTVPGNFKQEGKILDFTTRPFYSHGPVGFALSFENTGTVHFEPKGTITIRNIFGKIVGEVPINGTAVLPTGVRVMKFAWDTNDILLGRYSASAIVYDGAGNTLTTKEVAFWAFPLWYLFYFLVSVLILFGVFSFFKRRVRVSVSLK